MVDGDDAPLFNDLVCQSLFALGTNQPSLVFRMDEEAQRVEAQSLQILHRRGYDTQVQQNFVATSQVHQARSDEKDEVVAMRKIDDRHQSTKRD